MSDTPDPPDLRITPDEPSGQPDPAATNDSNPIDAGLEQEGRILLKSIRLPDDGAVPNHLQASIRQVVRDHIRENRLTYREVARQVDYAESTISEVLKGTYQRADPSPILRKLNAWIDDDERRRQKKRPLGFWATSVFETIRGLAQYAKSHARTPDAQRNPVATWSAECPQPVHPR